MRGLVFVEGVSGVGKTTTAARLCDALRTHGHSAICHLEGEADNPVDLSCCAYFTKEGFSQLLQDYPSNTDALEKSSVSESDHVLVRYGDPSTPQFDPPLLAVLKAHEGFYRPQSPIAIEQYTRAFADCWRRFLGQDQGDVAYAIFDGSLLYHRTNDLIQNYNASDEMIASHLKALLLSMMPYRPFLFYLSSEDVGERLIQARKSRGQAPASETRIALEVKRKHRQMQILESLPVQARVFDISHGDWANAIDEMVNAVTEDSQRKLGH